MININSDNDFLLGAVHVYPSRNQLAEDGRELTLQPKVMAVLCYLARNHERVVSAEELMEQLWPGRIVTQGSVQKSINFLRKALAEFFGDKEVISHFSKRGYQLTLAPEFIHGEPGLVNVRHQRPVSWLARRPMWLGLGALCFGLLLLIVLNPPVISPVQEPKAHQTRFSSVSEYSGAAGHVRDAEPHRNNTHVAYVRERLTGYDEWEIESELIIRNDKGEDWLLATAEGSWVSHAWSPDGRHLVAVEIWRLEGLPPTPNFFERANYLYTFHIFSLDLATNRLLEKHLLSQWQGRIFSVSWWDSRTLEFVATQGPDSSHERYRYTTDTQQLSIVESTKGMANPLLTAVLNQRTAVASAQGNRIKIDLLDEQQISHASWMFDRSVLDVSWIPDGSGVLVFSEAQQKLVALYWDGERLNIPLNHRLNKVASNPRFRPDGEAIYYTEETVQSIIWWLTEDQSRKRLTDSSEIHHTATFSPTGDNIVFAVTRDNEIQLWLREKEQERQLATRPLAEPVSRVIWSNNGAHIVYKSGRQIAFYDLLEGTEESLRLESDDIEPLAFDSVTQQLFVTKSIGGTNNIWAIHAQTLQQKQLTFGALGSTLQHDENIYFQYRGKAGLWVLRQADFKIDRVTSKLGENSQLLGVDAENIYFITGGRCRESDVFQLNFSQNIESVFMPRAQKIVATIAFHPQAGLLLSDCALPESNIMLLE